MTDTHAERVRDAFTTQAAAFEDSRVNRLFTLDATWLFERLSCDPHDMLLDVAAGTGHAARALADRVGVAIAIDVTPAMLAAGKRSAEKDGLRNVLFQCGDATALPFLDESFDIVITRFALHHIEQPELVLGEMARCLRPGGRLAVADMAADEDVELAGSQDRLERLRDPSHARILSISGLLAALDRIGLEGFDVEARDIDRPLAPWLSQSETGEDVAAAIRGEIAAEIAGGTPTGLRAYEADGELRFAQRWVSVLALKPPS